ncbi:outer membrane lipoprotein chaperone LolA [Marinicella sp. W31]|uniref:outer membrane lipoprotein chaperone LolA n=1 Tax=Marinicella sp. W31 TaxID=3023713 RepID=UPI003756EC7B
MRKIPFLFLFLSTYIVAQESQVESAGKQAQDSVKPDPQVILDGVRKDLTTLSAEFYQYELIEGNARQEENLGMVWMSSPDKFRWHYKKPYEQLIVADGEKVWVYDEDLEQVTVKAQSNNLNPIYVILNKDLSAQHYDMRYEILDKEKHWISLTPKERSEEVKEVWLGVVGEQLQTIKMINPFEQTLVFEFTKVKRNDDLPADMFVFTVPEGVDVIENQDNQTNEL